MARRGGGNAAPQIYSRDEAMREIEASHKLGVSFVAIGEADYPRAAANDRRRAAFDRGPRPCRGLGDAAGGHCRLAQCLGRRREVDAAHGPWAWSKRDLPSSPDWRAASTPRRTAQASHTGTIAVLAGGQDRVYPPEHLDLLDAILPAGVALTEMPLGWEPRARDFPRRNRLISGLSLGVVIVEAAKRSGSLITARLALEQGREVFAMPGSPLDPRAEGTNSLIKQGATPVTEAADIIAVLRPIMGLELPAREPEEEEMDSRGQHRAGAGRANSDRGAVKPDCGLDRRFDPTIAEFAPHRADGAVGVGDRRTAGTARRRNGVADCNECPVTELFLGGLIGFEPRHFQNVAQRIEAIAPCQLGKFLRQRCDVLRGTVGGLVPIEPVRYRRDLASCAATYVSGIGAGVDDGRHPRRHSRSACILKFTKYYSIQLMRVYQMCPHSAAIDAHSPATAHGPLPPVTI